MENLFNTDISTTNRAHYRFDSFLPRIKYHQIPSIQLKDAPKLAPRQFPIEPFGPARHWEKFDHNILPNIEPFTDKPIVRAPPPNKVIIKPRSARARRPRKKVSFAEPFRPDEQGLSDQVPREILDKLCHSLQWNTTTKTATDEACLPAPQVSTPNSTLEDNSDVVKHRPKRYESRPAPGQRVTAVWDRIQVRPHVGQDVARQQEQMQGNKAPMSRGHNVSLTDPLTPEAKQKIIELCKGNTLTSTYVRQCPGFAGHVPRSPVVVPMAVDGTTPNLRMMTTMQASYRPLPLNGTMQHAHRGPLSRTVTLTFPYNPYNKVENRAFSRKDIEHPW